MSEPVALGILGLEVPSGTHLCTFYRGPPGQDEILLPFLAEGIRARDRCLCITDSVAPADVLSKLARQVDVGSSVDTGQLELATSDEAYLRSGRFSTEEMLDYWGAAASDTGRGRLQPDQGGRGNAFGAESAGGPARVLSLRGQAQRGHPELPGGDLVPV